MSIRIHRITSVGLAAAILAPALHAATITLFNESFDAGSTAGWSMGARGSIAIDQNVAGLNSNALVLSSEDAGSANLARFAITNFAATTLANAGDTLTLAFDFKGITYGQNQNNRVTFGFFHSQETGEIDDDLGYIGLLRADTRTDLSLTASQFRGLDAGPEFSGSSNGYNGTIFTAEVAAGNTPFYLNGVADDVTTTGNIGDVFRFSYSISRMENGDLLLSQIFTNTTASTSFSSSALVPAASVLTYTFDTLEIGHLRALGVIAVDNVLVTLTTAIPEPGAGAALAAVAALGCVVSRRRGRAGSR